MKSALEIAQWLIGEGRLSGDGVALVEGFALHLREAGVPLWRLRINHQIANPLVAAWSVAWTFTETRDFSVPRSVLATTAWIGSPFQFVVKTEARSGAVLSILIGIEIMKCCSRSHRPVGPIFLPWRWNLATGRCRDRALSPTIRMGSATTIST